VDGFPHLCISLTLNLENIIAALNTGSGKTLISILLIKWIASQENAMGKVIVFLVPRVTLVDQQAETISKRTPLRVSKLFGSLDIELNNRAGWKKKIENQDVFVMTRRCGSTSLYHMLN
jgi:endoribonuclease Dicer